MSRRERNDGGGDGAPVTGALHLIASNDRRGAEVFATDLHQALVARGRADRIAALAPAAHPPGLGHPTLGDAGPGSARLARAVATTRAVRRLRAEARTGTLVAHGSTAVPVAALATAGRTRTGYVYRNIGDPAHWTARPVAAARVRAYLRGAARVVALWPQAAALLSERLGVPAGRIRVIPTGVPAARFPLADAAARAAARARLGPPWPPEAPVALYLGALSAEKDPALAVRAVARVPDLHLVLAGDGPERAVVAELAAALAPGRVHLAGVLPDPAPALAAADLVVVPSRTEGIAAVCIEAAFTGRAVVATDVGGTSQVVASGETGMLVPPGDVEALADALATTLPVADRFGAAARPRALARFEIGVVADAWAAVLGELDR